MDADHTMTIVNEIRRNRENGAKRLEEEYKAGLMTLARRFCADESDAEELVNRTLAAVVDGIDKYIEQSAFFGWMCQILSNIHSLDNRRKSNRDIVYPGNVPEVVDEDAREAIYRDVDAVLLREAVDRLPKDARELLTMHYFMDMPVAQIAKILTMPDGTVRSKLYYARKLLAAKLGAVRQKPGGKALLLALALAALTAVGAAGVAAVRHAAGQTAGQPRETPASLGNLDSLGSLEPLGTLAPLASLDSLAPAPEASGGGIGQPEKTTAIFNTNNEETTMNTQSVKSVAVKMLAAGAMLAAPTLSARSARADSLKNYQVLKYLESSGTQAIDTGVKYGPMTRMRFRMQVLNGSTVSHIGVIDNFGTGGKYDRFHFQVNNGIMRVWCDRQDGGCPSESSEGGTWHDYDINLVDNKFYRDGATDISGIYTKAYGYAGTTDEHSTIWLFGRNSNMPNLLSYATVRIGKVEIWQDGQIAERDRMLLPCKRLSDNVLGMYDVVKNEFLANVGTGTFVAGPEALGYPDDIPPQVFNGEPSCPSVSIVNGGHKRVENTDYTLAWTNNTETGLGKLTITPLGSYADGVVLEVHFWIVSPETKLPAEYQRIAYLESTKDGKQQIDTLIHPTGNMRIEIRFQSPSAALMGMVGMIDDSPSVERFHLGCTSSNPDSLFAGLGNNYTAGMSYSTYVGNNWATMVARTGLNGNDVPCGWFTVNATNTFSLTSIGTFRADNSTFGLFGRLSKNDGLKTYSVHRVMYMDVKEGDDQVLTHRFVPCRRIADGELGVYDTVARQFLYDTGRVARGAAAFVAGPDVGDGRRPGMIIYLH